jgi:FAD-dependent urate hydroxylase
MRDGERGEILVVGGGIGGLATAVALRQRGFDVRVFERAAHLVPERGTGLTLWGNAFRVLDGLGCGDQVRDQGGLVRTTEIRSHKGRLLIDTPIAEIARSVDAPDSYVVRRRDLLQALQDRCADLPVQVNRAASGYRIDGDAVVVSFEDGGEERGSALVCADGARSRLRAQLLADGDPIALGSPIWRGISTSDGGLRPGVAVLVWGPAGGGVGGGHVHDGAVSWTIAINSDANRRMSAGGEPPKRVLLDFIAGLDATLEEAVRSTPDDSLISGHVLVRRETTAWVDGQVALLGDAAHAMPTAFGQGGCQALEDAWVLAGRLADAADLRTGLREYEQVRRRRIDWLRERIERVDRFSRIESRALCAIRDLVVPRVPQSGSEEMWRRIMMLET